MGSLACLSPYSFFTRRKSMPPEGASPCNAVGFIMGSSLIHSVTPLPLRGISPVRGDKELPLSQASPVRGGGAERRRGLRRQGGLRLPPCRILRHPPFQGGLILPPLQGEVAAMPPEGYIADRGFSRRDFNIWSRTPARPQSTPLSPPSDTVPARPRRRSGDMPRG